MTDYRCYLLDGAGAIRSVEIVAGVGDTDAVDAARRVLAARPDYHGFELWQRNRRVHVEVHELL